eukprot:TCONS_00034421-protein
MMENRLSESMKAAELVGFGLTALAGFILNAIVILAVVYVPKPYICTKISLHLATSNIIGSILVTLLQGFGDSWLTEHDACKPFLFLKSFWCISCILMTSFLVYEGFFKIRHRLESLKKDKEIEPENCLSLKFTISLLWLSSSAVALMTFLLISMSKKSLCISYQHSRRDLVSFYYGFMIILPLLIMAVMNIIYKRKCSQHRNSIGTYNKAVAGKRIIQRDFHYMKSSFRLAQVLQITWVPHAIYLFCLTEWFVDNFSFGEIAYHMLKFLQWLMYFSCVLQPVALIFVNYQIKLVVLAKIKTSSLNICGGESKNNDFVQCGSEKSTSTKMSIVNLDQEEGGVENSSENTLNKNNEPYSPSQKRVVMFHNASSEENEEHSSTNNDTEEGAGENEEQSDQHQEWHIDGATRQEADDITRDDGNDSYSEDDEDEDDTEERHRFQHLNCKSSFNNIHDALEASNDIQPHSFSNFFNPGESESSRKSKYMISEDSNGYLQRPVPNVEKMFSFNLDNEEGRGTACSNV